MELHDQAAEATSAGPSNVTVIPVRALRRRFQRRWRVYGLAAITHLRSAGVALVLAVVPLLVAVPVHASLQATLVSSASLINNNGAGQINIVVGGEVQNTGSQPMNADVTVNFYDSASDLLATQHGFLASDVDPGEKSIFLFGQALMPGYAYVLVDSVVPRLSSHSVSRNFTTAVSHAYIDQHGLAQYDGTVTNNSTTSSNNVRVSGSFYDAGGAFVQASNESLSGASRTLAPGQSAPFSIYLSDGNLLPNYTLRVSAMPEPPPSAPPALGPTGASNFRSVPPFRILDTRPSQTLGPGWATDFQVTGVAGSGIPASGVQAALLNVTVTNTTRNSYLSIYPEQSGPGTTSNLNWSAGQTVANLVVVPLSVNGRATAYNNAGTADVIVDVAGYVSAFTMTGVPTDGLYTPLQPARVLDTRNGTGAAPGPLAGGSTLSLQVGGAGGVPAAGVESVVLNVTITNPSAGSYMTVWPDGTARPTASNLNWTPGLTVANRAVVKVGANGKVDFFNAFGTADVVADVGGYFPTSGGGLALTPMPPYRVFDSRGRGQVPANGQIVVQLPSSSIGSLARAALLNVTAVPGASSGYLTIWPDGAARPSTSDLNWGPSEVVPNLVVVQLGPGGTVDVYAGSGATDVIFDLVGVFS